MRKDSKLNTRAKYHHCVAPPMRHDLNSIKEKQPASYKSAGLASYPERSMSVFACKLSSRPLIWSEIYGTSSYRASRYRISLLAWRLISGCHPTQIPRSHWIPVYGYIPLNTLDSIN